MSANATAVFQTRTGNAGHFTNLAERGFQRLVAELRDDEIIRFFPPIFQKIHANLLLLFCRTRSLTEIRALALQCTRHVLWERDAVDRHVRHVNEMVERKEPAILLKGWDPLLLHSFLERKKGLILCSIRMGASGLLAVDLALQGIAVSSMAGAGCSGLCQRDVQLQRRIERSVLRPILSRGETNMKASGWSFITDRSERAGADLLAALKRNEVVVIYIDEPDYMFAPGLARQVPVQFFGRWGRVGDAVAQLAYRSGAVLLPALAVMDTGAPGRILYGTPWDGRETRRRGSEKQTCTEITSLLCSFLEHQVKLYADQWLGAEMLQSWWLPEPFYLN